MGRKGEMDGKDEEKGLGEEEEGRRTSSPWESWQ